MDNKAIALSGLIYHTICGSQAYGVALETSDTDTLGICIEPPQSVIGLNQFEQWESQEINGTIYGLRKFIRLALKGNPTITEMLWTQPKHWIKNTPIMDELRAMRSDFLSAHTIRAYKGYLLAQRERLLGLRGQKDIKRPELVGKYGYDTKFAMHAVRLGMMGCTLLQTGKLYLPLSDGQIEQLLAIRAGQWTLREVITTLEAQEEWLKVENAEDRSNNRVIPELPQTEKIEQWMIQQYLKHWRE